MSGLCRIFTICVFIFSFVTTKAQVNLQNGLVASYPFNGNANDVSGNNNSGTIVNGVSFSEDRFGNLNSATKYDGNDSYIRIVDNGAFSTPLISISLWFKTSSDNLQNLIGKRKFENDGTPGGGAQYQFFINYSPFPGIGSNLVGNNSSCNAVSNSSYLNTVDQICKERWYHAVVTYDGSYHKLYINGVLKRNEFSPFSSFLICNSELRFGVWWSGGTIPFQGLMDDIRWYNRPLNQSEVLALYGNYKYPSSLDFTFSQQPCSPKTVRFFSTNTNGNNYSWSFGNGVPSSDVQNPTINFQSYGDYPVQLLVQTAPGCIDTVRKVIPVNAGSGGNILIRDTTVCAGTSLKIVSDSGYNFCWNPDASISNLNIANSNVVPVSNTTYKFSTLAPTTSSLIINGDFSNGNTDFSSTYFNSISNTNTDYGFYAVNNNPKSWNSSLSNCINQNTGNGNVLVFNNNKLNNVIWKQTVKVQPNKNYVFSFQIQSLLVPSTSVVQLSINNNLVGDVVRSLSEVCTWKQYSVTWNSGNADSVPLMIINKYDFPGTFAAIDNIEFREVGIVTDSLIVTVVPRPILKTLNDTTICEGSSVLLKTSGAINYNWSPQSISNAAIESPIATPLVTTRYFVAGYNVAGCFANDTVDIRVLAKPSISITNDTTICTGSQLQLFASGGVNYTWTPSNGLSKTDVNNPVTSTLASIAYQVEVKDLYGCINKDSVSIVIAQKPFVTTINSFVACQGKSVNLTTIATPGVKYTWSPAAGLNDPTLPNPTATPLTSTDYFVTVTNAENCGAQDRVSLTILRSPVINKSSDTSVCKGATLQLFASGGINYKWTPSNGLSDQFISNPVSTVDGTIRYYVQATDGNSCSTTDSVLINVIPPPQFKIWPLTASICANDTITLSASGADKYEWLDKRLVLSPNTAITLVKPTKTSIYSVKLESIACKIIDTLSALITVNQLPNISISKSNDIDCSFPSARLIATGGVKYLWLPSANLSNSFVANPVASPASTTVYSVKATDSKGCASIDSIRVDVKFDNNNGAYLMPGAFTPNSDGKNDCFGIKFWGMVSNLEFLIFNRWGERVFHTKNPSDCWDGTFNSIPQNSGTFVYVIKAKTVCSGDIIRKGTVVLIR